MKPLRQFDLNLLLLLEALLTECHVSRAAEKMYLSQSAMSHALNRLREHLNDPVLVRTANGLKPTPRAERMLPEIREALSLIEHSLTPDTPFDPQLSERHFRIGSTDYFEATVLPELIAELQTSAPRISIEIEVIDQNSSWEKLANQQLDLIVGMEQSLSVPGPLIQQLWHSEPQVCLAGEQNEQIRDSLTLAQYLQQKHIVFTDLTGQTETATDRWLRELKHSRNTIARTVNYMAAARAAAMTDAIITLPQHMANLFCTMLPLKLITPPEGLPDVVMTMIHYPLYSQDPGLQWLREKIAGYPADQLINH